MLPLNSNEVSLAVKSLRNETCSSFNQIDGMFALSEVASPHCNFPLISNFFHFPRAIVTEASLRVNGIPFGKSSTLASLSNRRGSQMESTALSPSGITSENDSRNG